MDIVMSINRVIVSVIIAILVASVHGQEDTGDLTVDQYLGKWYDVAVMFPTKIDPNIITCRTVQATRRDDNYGSFDDVFTEVSNGTLSIYAAIGEIVDSDLHLKYSDSEEGTAIYGVTRFNGGNEMILHDKVDASASVLISRFRSIEYTTPSKATETFEALALTLDQVVNYIHNEECSLHH